MPRIGCKDGEAGNSRRSRPRWAGPPGRRRRHARRREGRLVRGLSPDGVFVGETEQAVRALQEAHGLTVDDILGRNFLKALQAANARPLSGTPNGFRGFVTFFEGRPC